MSRPPSDSAGRFRVLQILPELRVGGVETGTVDLARYLAARGHHSVVVSNGGELVERLRKAGVVHHALPVHRKSLVSARRCARLLREIIREEAIEIVHARSRVPAWIAWWASRGTSARFLTTCHGYYSRHVFSRVMGWGERVIVPSGVIGRHMIEDFGVPEERIRRIPRGVDLSAFRAASAGKGAGEDRRPTVMVVGRLTPLKGHAVFLEAVARLVRTAPRLRAVIVGEAPPGKEMYRRRLDLLVRRLGLDAVVEFWGHRPDVARCLQEADVVVFPSTAPEAFGRSIVEAQAVGIPVAATRLGGALEIIQEGETGLLVDPGDPESLATAVRRLLEDPGLRRRLVLRARKKVEAEYTVDRMCAGTLEVYEDLRSRPEILVIKVSAVGDVILATPSVRALRRGFPEARITWMVGETARPVVQRCPHIDDVIVVDRSGPHAGVRGLLRLAARLARRRFHLVIDLQNSRWTHILGALSFAARTVGVDNGKWGRLLTDPVTDFDRSAPPVVQQFRVLERAGLLDPGEDRLELWPSAEDRNRIEERLSGGWLAPRSRLVGVNVAASMKWTSKNWPEAHIAAFCDLLAQRNIRVVLTGTAADRPRAARIVRRARCRPLDLTGRTTVMELAALIGRCHAYLTPDSAPLHIAAAMDVPVVALFGPTDPRRHLPPAGRVAVLRRELPCVPCYRARCRFRRHACLEDIEPDEAAEAVASFLTEAS